MINTAFGVIIGAGLLIIGLPYPVLWGIVSALLRFVPYVGSLISAVLPIGLAAAVEPGWSTMAWTVGLARPAQMPFEMTVTDETNHRLLIDHRWLHVQQLAHRDGGCHIRVIDHHDVGGAPSRHARRAGAQPPQTQPTATSIGPPASPGLPRRGDPGSRSRAPAPHGAGGDAWETRRPRAF